LEWIAGKGPKKYIAPMRMGLSEQRGILLKKKSPEFIGALIRID
jgi:hypothetical protein